MKIETIINSQLDSSSGIERHIAVEGLTLAADENTKGVKGLISPGKVTKVEVLPSGTMGLDEFVDVDLVLGFDIKGIEVKFKGEIIVFNAHFHTDLPLYITNEEYDTFTKGGEISTKSEYFQTISVQLSDNVPTEYSQELSELIQDRIDMFIPTVTIKTVDVKGSK